jgi:CRP-like cAMP-binding protein
MWKIGAGMNDELKRLIDEECEYKMPEGLLDEFIGIMTPVHLKKNEVLMPFGKVDDNVYLLKSGFIRFYYFDGEKEKTLWFSSPGTVIISYHPHYKREPSFFQLESCGESVLMKISKRDFDEMVKRSHEFARWVLTIHLRQLYFNEFRYAVINGTAKERLMEFAKNRPEIMAHVPLKIRASYLGITPTYLSNLKKHLRKDKSLSQPE